MRALLLTLILFLAGCDDADSIAQDIKNECLAMSFVCEMVGKAMICIPGEAKPEKPPWD